MPTADSSPAAASLAAAVPALACDPLAPQLLSRDEQRRLLARCEDGESWTTAANALAIPARRVVATRRSDPAFAAALADAEDIAAERLAATLRTLADDADTPLRERISIGKQLLKQRPPQSWSKAAPIGRPATEGPISESVTRDRSLANESTRACELLVERTLGAEPGPPQPQPDDARPSPADRTSRTPANAPPETRAERTYRRAEAMLETLAKADSSAARPLSARTRRELREAVAKATAARLTMSAEPPIRECQSAQRATSSSVSPVSVRQSDQPFELPPTSRPDAALGEGKV